MENFSSLEKRSSLQLLYMIALVIFLLFFLFQSDLLAEPGKNVNTTAILENYTVDSIMNTLTAGVVVKDDKIVLAKEDIGQFDKEVVSSMNYYPPQFDSSAADLDSSTTFKLPSEDSALPIVDLPPMGHFFQNPNENLSFEISAGGGALFDNPNTVAPGHPGLWDPSAPPNDPSDPLVHPVRITEVEPVPEVGDCGSECES
ncbi:MAG: hypothetical protein HY582_02495 [Candidatus Omnitrophica bacterium]|nr:hypothetical protein [Candidatus Omnitrophota bacterium]